MGTLFDELTQASSRSAPSAGHSGSTTDPEALLAGLNAQQAEAVSHRGGPLLIVAGAGSGKTRVLTHRIAHLLASGDAHPGQILAITFTNKAANEMRQRLESIVGPAADRMWISTFHAACVRILRREASRLGYSSNFTIYDSADSQRLLGMIIKEFGLDPRKFTPRGVANVISGAKNELRDYEDYAAAAANPYEEGIASIFREYQTRLKRANAFDFDDLIASTVAVLQLFDEVRQYYSARFRHILVDEYQDTNHAQYQLIHELTKGWAEAGGELCVVGDADQSIYAFRGATIRNIEEFERDYPQTRTIKLEQNYRSTQNILDAANALIDHNPGRLPKSLWSEGRRGAKIVGYVADDEYDEARFVTGEIDSLADTAGVKPSDVAVFYRTNAQSRALEEVLLRVGLPYKIVGAVRFYERKEIKDALAYLRAIENPDDDVSVRRILNEPKRGIGDSTQTAIAMYAASHELTFLAALRRAERIPQLGSRAVKAVARFAALMDELIELRDADTGPAGLLSAALDRSNYLAVLQDSDDPQDGSRVENLGELETVAAEYEQTAQEPSLSGFLERISLVADADQIPDADGGQITLMTLHTAKGLEFPVVFLTGLEEGIFPHARTFDTDELPEERRLAYVGITRAMGRLYLTRAAQRSAWGTPESHPESRFLAELPNELIDWRRLTATNRSTSWNQPSTAARPATAVRPASGPGRLPPISTRPGERVLHDKFGMGTVVSTAGQGDQAEATVDFGSAGVKRLLLRYARLERL